MILLTTIVYAKLLRSKLGLIMGFEILQSLIYHFKGYNKAVEELRCCSFRIEIIRADSYLWRFKSSEFGNSSSLKL